MEKRIRVACCGNPFRGDDAAGIEVFKRLKLKDLPKNVELIDGGTAGIGLLPLFSGCSSVILVDGVIMDKDPGHIQWFSSDEIMAQNSVKISNHEMGLEHVLRIWHDIKESNAGPNISILGISIENTELRYNTLSAPVIAGVNRASEEVFERLWNDSNGQ